jgi:hypothetical protein
MCFKAAFIGFVAVFTLACAVGVAKATLINFADLNAGEGLNLQGSAAIVNGRLRLTPASATKTASAWCETQQAIDEGFSTTFQFQITQPGGITDDDGNRGAAGLAFVIQNYSNTCIGNQTNMGYEGIPNSIAVEFDTFRTSMIGDPNGNHISVQTKGTAANSAWHNCSLGCATDLPDMSDEDVHTASIAYVPGTMTIVLDGAPVLSVSLDIASKLNLNGGKAWAGFTSATYAAYENHDILNWSMTPVPEPSDLALLAAGAVGILAVWCSRRRKRMGRAA